MDISLSSFPQYNKVKYIPAKRSPIHKQVAGSNPQNSRLCNFYYTRNSKLKASNINAVSTNTKSNYTTVGYAFCVLKGNFSGSNPSRDSFVEMNYNK